LAIAISQVSRTVLSGSVRYSLRIGTEEVSEMAPMASAAWITNKTLRKKFFKARRRRKMGNHLMPDHRIFGGVSEDGFESWKGRWFLHLTQAVR